MLPNGNNPPIRDMTDGVRYHFFSGIGRGIVFTRQGLSGAPDQFLPITVPSNAKGKEMKAHITNTTTYSKIKFSKPAMLLVTATN